MTERRCGSLSDPPARHVAAADEADIHHNEWVCSCSKKACAHALVRILIVNCSRLHLMVQISLINDNRKARAAPLHFWEKRITSG